MDAKNALTRGCRILDGVLKPVGFQYVVGPAYTGHQKDSASGYYMKGDRKIEIHFRFSLGLVTYHMGNLTLRHEEYMRALLGTGGRNRYPGFSDDPIQAFHDLSYDLENFCADFLSGDGSEFVRCHTRVQQLEKLSGFQRPGS